jgi:hypothetical protein
MKRIIFLLALLFVSQWVTNAQTTEPQLQGYMAPDGSFVAANAFAGGADTLIAKYLQMYASAPTCSRKGQMYYDTVLNKQRVCTATPSTWETVASGSSAGTVTSVSVTTANGVSGSVATATTTPAITLTLGAITPSTVTIGAGSALTSSGAGGALGTNAFTSTTFAPVASPTFTGTVTIPTPFTLGATSVTSTGTELNYVAGVTSALQTQLNNKAALAGPTFTGTVTIPTPFTIGAVSMTATGTELNYVAGVTSAIQTQLNAKAALASPTFTGTPLSTTAAVDTNTTQIATTAFVLAQAASANPVIDGTAAPGTSTRYARGDHVHPTDTTRAALAGPTFTGTVTIPTGAQITKPNIIGTATNDSASAGSVGEYVSSSIATGSSVSLSTGTGATVTSISLTAGDWDVSGDVAFTFGATTSYTFIGGGVSTTAATLGGVDNNFQFVTAASVPTNAIDMVKPTPTVRISISGTTTVYLIAQSNFSVSTLKAYGSIRARRIR